MVAMLPFTMVRERNAAVFWFEGLFHVINVRTIDVDRPQVGLRVMVATSLVAGTGGIEKFGRIVHFRHKTLMESEIISRPRFVRRRPGDDGRMACVAFNDFLPFGHEIREGLPGFRSLVMVGAAAEGGDAP